MVQGIVTMPDSPKTLASFVLHRGGVDLEELPSSPPSYFVMPRFSRRELQDHFSTASPARFIRISPLDKGTGANPPAPLTYT